LNPADLPSRGCSGHDLVGNDKWLNGPDFLQLPKDQWPTDLQSTQHDELANTEIIKQPPLVTHSLTSHSKCTDACIHLEKIIDVEKFSKYIKPIRFVTKARKQSGPFSTELRAEELRETEKLWVQSIQNDSFAEELSCLKSGQSNKLVKQLRLFLDQDRIIRREGRISNSNLSDSAKSPIRSHAHET
jgi:hypothetical protein